MLEKKLEQKLEQKLHQLGDYILLKQLGQGALGASYLAQHQFLKRSFVLKVFPKEFGGDPAFAKRFEERVATLAELNHPALVKMHNVSQCDGHYFLVSDYKDTLDLNQYLDKNRAQISEGTLFEIASQVALALDFLHQSGKIGHLSLKPSNLLIQEEKGSVKVYLTDYGIAGIVGMGTLLRGSLLALSETLNQVSCSLDPEIIKSDSVQLPPDLSRSLSHHLISLAPEWRAGMQKICTHQKSDIYAFGNLVYYMLMREMPQGAFELPGKRLTKLENNWDALITSALQPSPGRRPDSLKELMLQLKSARTASAPSTTKLWSASSQEGKIAVTEALTKADKPRASAKVSLMTTKAIVEEIKSSAQPVLKPQELKRPTYDEDPAQVFQIDSTVVRFRPSAQAFVETKPLLTDMVIVPGGHFSRGSNKGARDEQPRHKIALSSFAIDTHPVSNEQFVRFLEVMGGEKDSNNLDIICLRDSRIKRVAGKLSIESGYTKHPVVGVSWYGAVAYAKWVGKRLPTEAEWEIAACGGSEGTLYPTGEQIERSMANFFSSDTTAVMSYPPNDYGLYDMAGNVYEWCEDWYEYNSYEASVQEPNDPKGPQQGVYRVLRGGCWKSLKEDLRSAHRHRNNPRTMNATYGFRCAADVSKDQQD